MRRVAEISTDCYAVPWGSAGEGHPIPRGRRGAETRRADQGYTLLCRPLAERLESHSTRGPQRYVGSGEFCPLAGEETANMPCVGKGAASRGIGKQRGGGHNLSKTRIVSLKNALFHQYLSFQLSSIFTIFNRHY